MTALQSWASTIAGAQIRLHNHPAIRPDDSRALNVDQLTPVHPDLRWHSAHLKAGCKTPIRNLRTQISDAVRSSC